MINPTQKGKPAGAKNAAEAINLWTVHEAGHVVMGAIAGYDFEGVELAFNQIGGLHGASTAFGTERKKHASARTFILVTIAGVSGELVAFGGQTPDWSRRGWDDDLNILSVFRLSKPDLETLFKFAREILQENRELHKAIANHMFMQAMVQVRTILTPQDFQGFLAKYPVQSISEERFDRVFPKLANPLVSYAQNPELLK